MEPSGSIFTFWGSRSMDEIWKTIVAEALDRGILESICDHRGLAIVWRCN